MAKLYLILSIHNHQPVGNFDHVLEEAYKKAYMPFLEKLLLHQKLKVVLHYSGNLLLWLEKRHPEAIDIMRTLINDKRAELLSGGFYEPVISSLPEKDRVMQIKELTAYIKDRFNYTPKGMWLTERVWEPHLPKYLSEADIEYISVDDYHFKLAGLSDADLLGYYMTEEEGHPIKVFPGSEKLRYYIPFRDIDTVVSYFREVSLAGGAPLLTLADDGEKFGVWPDTYKHCHEDGWLDRFFSVLEENSEWIETITFEEYQERFYPAGTVYLPTASYREMGEWTLPPEAALDYEYALAEMQMLFGDRAKSLIRGGTWRAFFAKYPESNHIHKRMLQISRKVHEAVKKLKVKSLKLKVKKSEGTLNSKLLTPNLLLHELWKGQCNDAYWHGIFGGLYLPHLRSSLYRHLLNAEQMAEDILVAKGQRVKGLRVQKIKSSRVEKGDIDCDGFRDVCVSTQDLTAFFTEESGALIELSVKEKQINVLDVLTRRPEAYHSRLSEASHGEAGKTETTGHAKTIHDRLSVKEEGLQDYLIYDDYRRASLIDHFFDYNIKLDDLMMSEYEEKGDFIGNPYAIEDVSRKGITGIRLSREGTASGRNVRVDKTVTFRESGIRVDYLLKGRFNGFFAPEFNISFLGSPYASIQAGDGPFFIRDKGMHEGVYGFSIRDEFLKLRMVFSFDEAIELWHYPVETISLSEQGVEKIYQGTAFLCMNRLDFVGNKKLGFTIRFEGV